MRTSLALAIGGERSPTVRPLIPADTQPAKIFHHGASELRTGALRIEIFVAQNQIAAVLPGPLGCSPKCAGVSQMEESGRGRREASPIRALRV